MEARRLAGGSPVGSHHYLLGLLAEENSLAAKVLAQLGVSRQAVEERLSQLDPAGTSDETPEEAGARRIRMRVENKLLTLEIDDPQLAEAMEKAMTGRKVRIITGADPEAAGFPSLWAAVSRTVEDMTRRLTRMTGTTRGSTDALGAVPSTPPAGWDPTTLAAGYTFVSTESGFIGHFEVGQDVDRVAARAWLREWLQQNRAQLLGPTVEEAASYCAMWALVSRTGQPFGMQNVGFEAEGAGCQPVTLDVLIDAAVADLA